MSSYNVYVFLLFSCFDSVVYIFVINYLVSYLSSCKLAATVSINSCILLHLVYGIDFDTTILLLVSCEASTHGIQSSSWHVMSFAVCCCAVSKLSLCHTICLCVCLHCL